MLNLFRKLKRWFHNQMIESEKADKIETFSKFHSMAPPEQRGEIEEMLKEELKKLDEKKMK